MTYKQDARPISKCDWVNAPANPTLTCYMFSMPQLHVRRKMLQIAALCPSKYNFIYYNTHCSFKIKCNVPEHIQQTDALQILLMKVQSFHLCL